MSDDAKHPDLLTFVAGLRPPQGGGDGGADVSAHLAACAGCRAEAEHLRSLRDTLRRAAGGGHLADAILVQYDEASALLDGVTRAAIEAHLERCGDCRDDLATLARARQARERGTWTRPPAAGAAPRRSRPPYIAAAAALVALAVGAAAISAWRGFAPPDPTPSPPPSVAPTFMPPKRSGTEDRRLVAGSRASIHVVLPLQTAEGTYRARVERDDGTPAGGPGAAIASRDESVTVDIETPAAPGAYRLVLDRVGATPPESYVYPFRVEAAPLTRPRPE